MHNLVNTPAYATLAVFGVSACFTWFWVRGWQGGSAWSQALAGLLAGLLVLTRLETVVIVAVLLAALALTRQWRFLRNFVLGGLPVLALLLLYNASQFGNALHAGILKGDMNVLTFDLSYVLATLVGPQSGILFWSTLTVLGDHRPASPAAQPALRSLGWAALALIALIALRVPVMYGCIGQGTLEVSGITVICPPDMPAMLQLDPFRRQSLRHPAGAFCRAGAARAAWTTITSFSGDNHDNL